MTPKKPEILDIGTDQPVVEAAAPGEVPEACEASASACGCSCGHDGHDHDGEGFSLRGELSVIGLSLALFIIGLLYKGVLHATPFLWGEYLVFLAAYLIAGREVLASAGRNILRGRVFDENFLMSVATLGAIAIHALPEAVGVMLFFRVGEFFQSLSVSRSRRSIQALLEIRPDSANLSVNGELRTVPPEEVRVGDTIVVRPGERVPLDGDVLEGASQLDTSALTGEPVPRKAASGDLVMAGMINKTGTLTVRVTKVFSESSLAKILDLVENAGARKAPTEKFITRFAAVYTPAVVFTALGVAFLPPLLLEGAAFSTWIYRALILLVISCPCALVVSIPMGYFGGVGGASRRGILIKGSNYLDVLNAVKTVVFDKTGTLTRGVFRVLEVAPHNGVSREGLLRLAAFAESQSNHPIAQSVLSAWGEEVGPDAAKDYTEIAGHGVRAVVDGSVVLAGNDRLMHRENIAHDTCGVKGTVVHVASGGVYRGYIVIGDELKEDARRAVRELKGMGVEKVMMFTGDNEAVAREIAEALGLDACLAELLPEEKVGALEKEMAGRKGGGKVAFVGDGINDAPVITRADVGVAMGALGSDAAIDTADVVLMTDAPSKVAEAMRVARKTHRIVWQNIVFSLGVKGVFILLGIAGLASMWGAVFADVGVALLAIANATRVLRYRAAAG